MSVTATAKVEFALYFDAGSWGEDCTVAQVRKQTNDGAHQAAMKVVEVCAAAGIKLHWIKTDETKIILLPKG